MKLTKSEINYIFWLISEITRMGYYYGNKNQFDRRVERVVNKLNKEYEKNRS